MTPQDPARVPDLRVKSNASYPQTATEQSEENKYGPDGPVCGLGVVLVPTAMGSLCVASITEGNLPLFVLNTVVTRVLTSLLPLPGGPAARSGRVQRGDYVETIDGVSVKGMTISAVRPLILGRAGTTVTLG